MPEITSSDTFVSSLDDAQLRERVLAWFTAYAHKVAADQPGRLEITSGSQAKMRLIGGAFIANSSLPTRTILEWAAADGGTQVTVTAHDAVGVGLKTGMNKKYKTWVAEIVAGLRAALTS